MWPSAVPRPAPALPCYSGPLPLHPLLRASTIAAVEVARKEVGVVGIVLVIVVVEIEVVVVVVVVVVIVLVVVVLVVVSVHNSNNSSRKLEIIHL